jgi:hypothetical protein
MIFFPRGGGGGGGEKKNHSYEVRLGGRCDLVMTINSDRWGKKERCHSRYVSMSPLIVARRA